MAARKAKQEKPARRGRAEAEAAVEETAGGPGIDDAIILTTFLMLVGALTLVVFALDAYPKLA
jgi:hypothetical protein